MPSKSKRNVLDDITNNNSTGQQQKTETGYKYKSAKNAMVTNSLKSVNFEKSTNCVVVLKDINNDIIETYKVKDGSVDKMNETLDEQNKPEEKQNFKVFAPEQMISAESQFKTKKRKKTTNEVKINSEDTQENPTKKHKKKSKKNQDKNSPNKKVEPQEKQVTQTTVEKLSKLPDNNKERLTESVKHEEVIAEQISRKRTPTKTVKTIHHGRPKRKHANNNLSICNCQYKLKCTTAKKILNKLQKRLKTS